MSIFEADPAIGEGGNSIHVTSTLGSGGPAVVAVYPNAVSGLSTNATMAGIDVFATDYAAAYTNYDALDIQSIKLGGAGTGSAKYQIVSQTDGVNGSHHPIEIGIIGQNKFTLETNGSISINQMPITGATSITGSTISFSEIASNVQELKAVSSTSCLLRISPNTATVSVTTTRGQLRVLNNTGANAEYLLMEARGTNGFILDINKDGSGTVRDFNIASAASNVMTITSTPIIKSLKPHQFDDYEDKKVITIPADPAAGYVRVYPKATDANTDSLYMKAKVQGAVEELNFFP